MSNGARNQRGEPETEEVQVPGHQQGPGAGRAGRNGHGGAERGTKSGRRRSRTTDHELSCQLRSLEEFSS